MRKALTILLVVGFVVSVGLWVVNLGYRVTWVPKSLRCCVSVGYGGVLVLLPEQPFPMMSLHGHVIAYTVDPTLWVPLPQWSPPPASPWVAEPGTNVKSWRGLEYSPSLGDKLFAWPELENLSTVQPGYKIAIPLDEAAAPQG